MLNLRTTHKKAIELLVERIKEAKKIPSPDGYYDYYQAIQWVTSTYFILRTIYGENDEHIHFFGSMLEGAKSNNRYKEVSDGVKIGWTALLTLIDEIEIVIKNPEFQEPFISTINPAIQDSIKKYKMDYPHPKKTAFIMMRFGETSEHKKIVEAIKMALMKNEIYGLRADEMYYHEDLYYNVLTYLHGCDFGIAVFEVIEDREYNPNVAFEVGYLKALNIPVCLLKEKTLERLHSDLIGKNYNEFDMNNCESSIEIQLNDWLFSCGFTRPT
jgi:nucleoside 2-deoxyribosyltransferase